VWEWIAENAIRKRNSASGVTDITCQKLFDATCKAAEIANGLIGRLSQYQAIPSSARGTIRGGERDMFMDRVAAWASRQDGACICISDPYFSPNDIDFLRVLSQAAPRSTFKILTSREQMKKKSISMPDEDFAAACVAGAF
jgi:hypothetical protein